MAFNVILMIIIMIISDKKIVFKGCFWPEGTTNIFKINISLINSTRAFDWCINCHTWSGVDLEIWKSSTLKKKTSRRVAKFLKNKKVT
jgi:hypothetical protein